LLRVVDVKGDPGSPAVILDAGINAAVRPALVRTEQRLAVLAPDAASRERVPVTAAGPLCTGLDVLARGAILPRPRVGDLVAMLDAGAYGFTESMPLFLSHPIPAEVAIEGAAVRTSRLRVEPT
jgi:diaminopimelate decarboxylase